MTLVTSRTSKHKAIIIVRLECFVKGNMARLFQSYGKYEFPSNCLCQALITFPNDEASFKLPISGQGTKQQYLIHN